MNTPTRKAEHIQTLIAGQWRDASGSLYSTEYPFDGSVVATLHAATVDDVNEAVEAAEVARLQPAWANLMPHQRAAFLHKIAAGIRARAEELAQLQMLDNGKPITECRGLVASAAGTFQYFAAVCETFEDAVTPQRGEFMSISMHEPLGVVGAITPWNSPIASEAQKLAPALAAGCAVVIKPAEITPRMAIELARIIDAAGKGMGATSGTGMAAGSVDIPKALVSVLPGKGSVVGDALVRHPLIKRIAFTGGTTVGKGIAKLAAEKLMPVSLELGGKSPTIVCADADLDVAVAGVLYGIFSSSGESCIAGSRCFVHASRYDEFKVRLVAGAKALRVGNPSNESTQMGPLISSSHRAGIERYVALGLAEGGTLLCGGARPAMLADGSDAARGYFYEPTIFEGLANTAQMCREEIFGPVLALIPYSYDGDLIAQCNDNEYGLASGIWTKDYQHALKLGKALQTGTVWINTYKVFSIATAFGGVKNSGMGREKGYASIMEYMTQKSFYWGLSEQPNPWSQS
jgi:betaine-aldehyde dehydrogenase